MHYIWLRGNCGGDRDYLVSTNFVLHYTGNKIYIIKAQDSSKVTHLNQVRQLSQSTQMPHLPNNPKCNFSLSYDKSSVRWHFDTMEIYCSPTNTHGFVTHWGLLPKSLLPWWLWTGDFSTFPFLFSSWHSSVKKSFPSPFFVKPLQIHEFLHSML